MKLISPAPRWAKVVLLAAVPIALGAVLTHQQSWRPQILLWDAVSPGVNSYPVVSNLAWEQGGALLTATDDAAIRRWNASTVSLQGLSPVPGMPRCGTFASPMAFSPDGLVLAAVDCDGSTVLVWSAQGALLHTLKSRESGYLTSWSGGSTGWGGASHIAIAPSNRIIAVAGARAPWATGTRSRPQRAVVALWDMASEQELRPLELPSPALGIAFSPDGRLLAAATAGAADSRATSPSARQPTREPVPRIAQIWDARRGTLVRTLSSAADALAFSPDGKVLSVGATFGAPIAFDVASGRQLQRFENPNLGSHGDVAPAGAHALAYSPDGALLAGADQRSVHLWNARSGKYLRSCMMLNTPQTIGPLDVGAIAFSPDSSLLAIAGRLNRAVTLLRVQ